MTEYEENVVRALRGTVIGVILIWVTLTLEIIWKW